MIESESEVRTIKRPLECSSLDDIRAEIDAVDCQIITALGKRMEYVKAASAFKPNAQSIPAPERVAAMLPQRHSWAQQAGLDADFIQQIFGQLIAHFINEQVKYWHTKAERLNSLNDISQPAPDPIQTRRPVA